MSDMNFSNAVSEWEEVYEKPLTPEQLEAAKHFFKWGAMVVEQLHRKPQDRYGEFVTQGWGGSDSFTLVTEGQNDG